MVEKPKYIDLIKKAFDEYTVLKDLWESLPT
jgi:hypothetical protein